MEITQRAKPEVDPVRLEKLNDEIFKKEEELARNKDEYLGEKRFWNHSRISQPRTCQEAVRS